MLRPRLALALSICLGTGCAPAVGPLFTTADASVTGAASAPNGKAADAARAPDTSAPDAASSVVRAGMRLQYQLQGTLDQTADADLFVVDLFDTSSAEVEQLHMKKRVVVAYIAAGSYEPWRPDVASLPDSVVGAALANYPDEAWLDVRASSVRQLMAARLTLAADKGFDGALLVSLDGYLTETGYDLTATDQLDYNLWLAQQAASRGLSAGISSDWSHADRLASAYDFAIHLNCLASGRCAELTPYRERGHAVFDLETSRGPSTCSGSTSGSLPVTLKNANFDAWLVVCP
jgi:hypothetical protein